MKKKALTEDALLKNTILEHINASRFEKASELIDELTSSVDKKLFKARLDIAAGDYATAKLTLYGLRNVSSQAVVMLNELTSRLEEQFIGNAVKTGKITDYSGRQLDINTAHAPVNARLGYEAEGAVLELSFNVCARLLPSGKLSRPPRCIIQGLKLWEGNYKVFGGYPLTIRLNITQKPQAGGLTVNIFTQDFTEAVTHTLKKLGKKGRQNALYIAAHRQTALVFGKNWRISSPKYINIYENDLENTLACKYTIAHEFGHILGLGDLYRDSSSGLEGAKEIPCLEPYFIKPYVYNMLMCSRRCPPGYKEVEMVLLAYQYNCWQNFQRKDGKGSISAALLNT